MLLPNDVWSSKQLLRLIRYTPVETDALKQLMVEEAWHDAVRAYFGDGRILYSKWPYRALIGRRVLSGVGGDNGGAVITLLIKF